ncbi:MAG: response regulator [Chloroflexi bacterium]|nr:MAG: response regulator [Chloroflexota bacterium]
MGSQVLVIDDDPLVSAALEELLELVGVACVTCRLGNEALRLLNTAVLSPDVVILDLRLPDIDGIQVLHAIRQHHPTLPIIIATGYEYEQFSEALTREKNLFFLQKPFNAEKFLETIQKILPG